MAAGLRPEAPPQRSPRQRLISVVAVAWIATVGLTEKSPWPIVLAVLLALPASIVALPCYYVVYGVLAPTPVANPSSNTGFETSTSC